MPADEIRLLVPACLCPIPTATFDTAASRRCLCGKGKWLRRQREINMRRAAPTERERSSGWRPRCGREPRQAQRGRARSRGSRSGGDACELSLAYGGSLPPGLISAFITETSEGPARGVLCLVEMVSLLKRSSLGKVLCRIQQWPKRLSAFPREGTVPWKSQQLSTQAKNYVGPCFILIPSPQVFLPHSLAQSWQRGKK